MYSNEFLTLSQNDLPIDLKYVMVYFKGQLKVIEGFFDVLIFPMIHSSLRLHDLWDILAKNLFNHSPTIKSNEIF